MDREIDIATALAAVGLIVLAVANLTSASLLGVLHRLTDRPFLKSWALSWALFALYHLAFGASSVASQIYQMPTNAWPRVGLASLYLSAGFGHALFTVIGARELASGRAESPSRVRFFGLVCIALAMLLVTATLSMDDGWRRLARPGPRALISASAFFYAAQMAWKSHLVRARPGSRLCAIGFGLLAIRQLVLVVSIIPPLSVPEYLNTFQLTMPFIDVALQLMCSFGMVVSLFDEEREAAVVARDQLLRTEESLQRSHKMEAVGRLAGGIAHDFNNALTGIMGYTDLIAAEVKNNPSATEFVEGVRKSAGRAKSMVQRLLSFSRKQVVQTRVIDINAVCHDFAEMVRRIIGEDVNLVLDLADDCGRVAADPNQIHQALMNLALNSRDAMPQGGTLTMATLNYEALEDQSHSGCRIERGRYVVITVTDTGCGMDSATRRRVFEPFFTTKRNGTGLGLAMVYSIVRQAHGVVGVDSILGRGTTFKIFLKRSFDDLTLSRSSQAKSGVPGGVERVLLVEDDDAIRDVSARCLTALGYQVAVAESAETALALVETGTNGLSLLITDMVLGGMSGPELARRLWTTQPDLRVLFISGYAGTVGTETLGGPAAFLQKPFEQSVLALTIRDLLDQSMRSTIKRVEVVQRGPG